MCKLEKRLECRSGASLEEPTSRSGGGRALLEATGADRVFDRMADFDQVAGRTHQ